MPTTSRSRITTRHRKSARASARAGALVTRRLPRHRALTHPGEILLEDWDLWHAMRGKKAAEIAELVHRSAGLRDLPPNPPPTSPAEPK